LINVTVSAHTADSCSSTTWKITDVTSNEAVDALGDGHTAPDWIITGDHTIKLRAERSGTSNGRTYTISLQATDSSGNVSGTKQVTVRVPKSQGK
jgi:dTDP-D-glucose 4,6-dehydratase